MLITEALLVPPLAVDFRAMGSQLYLVSYLFSQVEAHTPY